jgi:hypothetical protein
LSMSITINADGTSDPQPPSRTSAARRPGGRARRPEGPERPETGRPGTT